jgi:hypothetical protein
VKVVLGTFTYSGIRALSGGDVAAGVRAALDRYAGRDELEPARRTTPCRPELRPAAGVGTEIELALDPEMEAALEREAHEAGGVSMDQVVTHAVLTYLADLDRASELDTRPLAPV